MIYKRERTHLLNTIWQACDLGLTRISAGNFSTRIDDDLVAITPAGINYKTIQRSDISIVDLDGNLLDGPTPSSEIPMHTAIYRNISRAISICHTHSIYGMVFAMLGEDIPLMSIELMVCGAPIPVAPWAAPGTTRAGEVAVDLLQSRPDLNVLLLRQHGMLAIGNSLDQALERAYNAEIGLEVYYKAKSMGKPQPFTKKQIAEIKEVYG
jgi:L-fuculose-phosphate aldolase